MKQAFFPRMRSLIMSMMLLCSTSSLSCTSSTQPELQLSTVALRAPRPSIQPERKDYRPRLPLRDSAGVRRALSEFLGPRKPFLQDALQRYPEYIPVFTKVFSYYGIPVEMSSLAIVESRLQNEVQSARGAGGLWQFMPRTARRYGLRVSILHDDREDPGLSTIAAAQYLNRLYSRFGDWFLVIAAYNCGPTRLSRIIEREGTNDFFELAERGALSTETRQLVERVIAVTMILRNREAYGF